MKEEYPTEKDIELHTKQLISGLRQYFRIPSNIEFVKNDLRVLFTDLMLEAHNEEFEFDGINVNFDSFIRELAIKPFTHTASIP